jgi:hypothetical protein
MDKIETIPNPPDWGDDKLSEYLQRARNNQLATFVNLRPAFDILKEIDECFVRIAANMLNPKRNLLAVLLLYRSHAAYRAACGTSMAGQSPETFVLLRSCLEYSGYALLIHKNPNLAVIWLNRHDDAAALREMRREFQAVNVEKAIQSTDAGLGRVYEELYNRAIDFGGHPNTRGVTGSMQLEKGPDLSQYLQIYLHGDDMALRHCLKSTAQIGLCSLHLFQHILTERFMLLGIREKLIELRGRL